MSRLLHAITFAEQAHRGQTRKYTNEPYIVHPLEVASIVSTVTDSEDTIIAALLHDVVEDCGVDRMQIAKMFGTRVGKMVSDVTDIADPMDGNREKRKAIDRMHIADGWPESKTIKLADMISNTRSITQHDPKFAKVYMAEKRLLLPVLIEGSYQLHTIATALVADWESKQ